MLWEVLNSFVPLLFLLRGENVSKTIERDSGSRGKLCANANDGKFV